MPGSRVFRWRRSVKGNASVLPTCRSAGVGHAAWECQRNSLRLELYLFAFLTAVCRVLLALTVVECSYRGRAPLAKGY